MDYKIENCRGDDEKCILKGLLAYNDSQVSPAQRAKYVEVQKKVTDSEGNILAGCLAGIYFGCVLAVDILWVSESCRHQGLGSKLLQAVESEGKAAGCTLVHLDTFDFQAKDFYRKQGYTLFGTLEDCPQGHCRYYLKKNL